MNATNERPAWFLLTRHWLSRLGVVLVVPAVMPRFVLPVPIPDDVDNPYVGIVTFLLHPLVFFAGLTLVPIGIYLRTRPIRKRLEETETPFEFDVLQSQCRKCSQWALTHG